jgi:hypothetical protein
MKAGLQQEPDRFPAALFRGDRRETDRRHGRIVDLKAEDVWPRIVPSDIERATSAGRGRHLYLAIENGLVAMERPGHRPAKGPHDNGVAIADLLVVSEQRVPLGKIGRHVAAL